MSAPPAGRRVLVVGSYPPAATAGTATTLATVRDLVADGADPVVSSPRSSAARYAVPVAGVVAGRRLLQLRRATGAAEVVIVAERDFPVRVAGAGPAVTVVQRLTVAGLARAAAAFDRVTVVRCGDTGVPDRIWAPLDRAAERVERRPAGPALAGVTPLGPEEGRNIDLARRAVQALARRALGPSYDPVRARAGRLLRRARQLTGR